jgi:hypothetical protein
VPAAVVTAKGTEAPADPAGAVAVIDVSEVTLKGTVAEPIVTSLTSRRSSPWPLSASKGLAGARFSFLDPHTVPGSLVAKTRQFGTDAAFALFSPMRSPGITGISVAKVLTGCSRR